VTRFKYLSSIPLAFFNADDRDGAADCLEQFRSVPRDAHGSFSVLLFDELCADMQVVADGGEASDALRREV